MKMAETMTVSREALERSRAARASVTKLDLLLGIGRKVVEEKQDPLVVAARWSMTAGEVHEAERLYRAEARGLFTGGCPFTLEEARMAAGIE